MQFLVIGRDGDDEEAMERRLAARAAHIAMGDELLASGNMWYGCALWDDDNRMIGSALLMDFASEAELKQWLDKEPYVVGNVWKTLEVLKCNVREPWQFNRPREFFEDRERES